MELKGKNILVTGGCGYVGSVLVAKLLAQDANVTVFDNQWFGNYLDKNHKLEIIKDCSSVGIQISKKRSHEKL